MFFLPGLVTKSQVTHNLPLAEQPMRSCSLFGELAWETGREQQTESFRDEQETSQV